MYKHRISQKSGIFFEVPGVPLNCGINSEGNTEIVFRKEEGEKCPIGWRIFPWLIVVFAFFSANLITFGACVVFAVSTAKKLWKVIGYFQNIKLARLVKGISMEYDETREIPTYQKVKKETLFDNILADYCIEIICVIGLIVPILGLLACLILLVGLFFYKTRLIPDEDQYEEVKKAFYETLKLQEKIKGNEEEIARMCCDD